MICPKCGRPIPDGSACSCTYVTPAFSNNPAVNALKASGASPLFLSAVILYTLTPLLSVVTALTGGGVSLVKTITESAAQSDPAEGGRRFLKRFIWSHCCFFHTVHCFPDWYVDALCRLPKPENGESFHSRAYGV